MQSDSLHTLIYRLNMNTHALCEATKEIGDWIGVSGDTTISQRISEHLELIENNSEVISTVMADMVITGTPQAKR
ncbi:hypothetical protein RS3R6_03020 [Pseudomonas atacamensis]|uniref:PhoU domain-containing protein n=1 Tax=Pseudomonas atacamensis TaxID=2565368 RepID=A0ABQ5PD03_9PSED|nr:hypothetical protein [Pseudomonas atacamensis]GLH41384.1 hypothetical protein RS3R1_04710 [Pseudomonas atacamensis]GLH52121.1 hypothetical protein RS3R6_03020 [Pseudomonas atacamensis]